MSLMEIHTRLAGTALLFSILMSLWGFFRFFRKQGVGSSYWGAAVVAVILILVQGGLGVLLWFTGEIGQRPGYVHWLYGAALALAIPLVYSYTKGKQERPEMLLYAVAFLIMVGLVLRAMVTGIS
jgi:hypothetical protein